MSEPQRDYEDSLYGILAEIQRAMSALNMPHKDIDGVSEETLERGWLAETDYWARHAYAHLKAALDIILEYREKMDKERITNLLICADMDDFTQRPDESFNQALIRYIGQLRNKS